MEFLIPSFIDTDKTMMLNLIRKARPSAAKRIKTNETIQFGQTVIPFTLIKSPHTHNLSIKIKQDSGLEVVVPHHYPLNKVPRFIHQKENWILKHLKAAAEKKAKIPKFQDGVTIPILGIPKTVRILPTRKKRPYIKEARALKFAKNTAYYDNPEILIYCPHPTQRPQLTKSAQLRKLQGQEAKQTLEKHLRKEANTYFKKRTAQIAEQMNLKYNRITIKGQKSRWGSCSRKKNLNFNWRLILASLEIIDAIIIHELAHLKHLNHGPKFYELVYQHCPNYKALNKELQNWQAPI